MKKIIFIAWNSYHTRNYAISKLLKIKSFHVGKNESSNIKSIISYFYKSICTYKIIRSEKPSAIVVTNSIFILPLFCHVICKFMKINLILDTHSSGIENKSFAYPFFLRKYLARKSLLSLVTNKNHKKIVEKWGGRSIEFPDPPIKLSVPKNSNIKLSQKFNLVYISNYSSDEPYEAVINAIKNNAKVHLYITGNPNKKLVIDEKNITHTGYLKIEDYRYLISKAHALMVLTNRENTFQCGGNEALSLKKPLIISRTKFLCEYFEDAAIYVLPNEYSIKNGIDKMYMFKDEYEIKINNLFEKKLKELDTIINNLKSKILGEGF